MMNRKRGPKILLFKTNDSPMRPQTNPHLVNEAKTPLLGAAFVLEKENAKETKE